MFLFARCPTIPLHLGPGWRLGVGWWRDRGRVEGGREGGRENGKGVKGSERE
jgi:hypothetical protein